MMVQVAMDLHLDPWTARSIFALLFLKARQNVPFPTLVAVPRISNKQLYR